MSENQTSKFVCGVLDTFELANTDDLAVVGRVKGTLNKGDKICITNYGDDDDELVVSSIVAIEVDKKPADSVTDSFAALRIREGASENIKPGSVLHSEDTEEDDIRLAYVSSIGDSYVGRRDLEIYETELNRMSITDCSEAWRIFNRVHEKKEGGYTDEEIKELRRKIGVISRSMAKKILSADEIYCVYNKKTGEPHMFSRTIKRGDDFICSPPEVQLFTKPYKGIGDKYFTPDQFEITKIENGENNEGIKQFLFDIFYLNGALGIRVNFENVVIGADSLIKKPDYTGKKEHEIPVTNPQLVRWMLLRSQLGTPETDAEKMVARIYYRFFAIEMTKARFLVPMKQVDDTGADVKMPEIPEELKDENGEAPEMKRLRFPILVGKNRRNMVFLFTDFKRLRIVYDEEWGGFIQPIDKFINNFDCYINSSNNKYQAGCFVNKETYDEIIRMLNVEVGRPVEGQEKAEETVNAEGEAKAETEAETETKAEEQPEAAAEAKTEAEVKAEAKAEKKKKSKEKKEEK